MILRYMQKRDWVTAGLCTFFIILQVYLDLRIPEYMSAITDAIVGSQSPDVISGYGYSMLLCAFGSVAVSMLSGGLAVLTATSLCHSLRERMFRKICDFSPEDVGKFSVDSLITRCSNDVTQMQNFLAQALQVIVKTPILTVWALVKISGSEWEWTVATATGVVILALAISAVILSTYPRFRRVPVLTDRINHSALEHLTGLRIVRAHNAERFQEQKFEEASRNLRDNSIYLWKRSSLLPAISSATSNFLTLTIYWTGISLIAASGDSPHNVELFSDMIVFSSYMIQVIGAFVGFSFFIQFSSRSLASSKRVQEILQYKPVISDGDRGDRTEEYGTVEFDNVSFTYPGTSAEAVSDISFKIKQGQTLAIIGSTGSGKSTIVRLLLRFYKPGKGSIRVDGVDISSYKCEALYRKIGYVPQNTVMFTGTVDSNIRFGSNQTECGEDDLVRALRIAQAEEFVSELSDKADSPVSENGINFSGGQRQRLSIARAVCKNAEITLFDDPFSALDFATDRRLRKALNEEMSGRTRILITQRVGTAMDSDMIMVLVEGRIAGLGTHSELMENCPLYHDLAVMQMAEGTR